MRAEKPPLVHEIVEEMWLSSQYSRSFWGYWELHGVLKEKGLLFNLGFVFFIYFAFYALTSGTRGFLRYPAAERKRARKKEET